MSDVLTFKASIAPLASAISIDGATNEAKIMLLIPSDELGAAVKLINMRNHNLVFAVKRTDRINRYDADGRVKPALGEVNIDEEESGAWYA